MFPSEITYLQLTLPQFPCQSYGENHYGVGGPGQLDDYGGWGRLELCPADLDTTNTDLEWNVDSLYLIADGKVTNHKGVW